MDVALTNTDLRTVVETAPVWLAAFRRTLGDPLFQQIVGSDYRRVTLLALSITQIVRLRGQGPRDAAIRNSRSMGHFLRFGLMPGESAMSPTIEQLGIGTPLEDSVGRVDVNLSYERQIAGKPYKVWFRPEAPMNENAKLIHVNWEVQDIFPTDLLSQQYGHIMTEFFRDVVLKGVYSTWFEQIHCSTVRSA